MIALVNPTRSPSQTAGQPNSMFALLKREFGCKAQPNSMFIALNTESGCTTKPNSLFMSMNR